MIVICPLCNTRYQVDPRALGADGRMVRCAHCSHTWHQAPPPGALPPVAETEAPSPPPPPPVPPQRPAPPRAAAEATAHEGERGEERIQLPALPRRGGGSWVAIGWIVLLLIVVGGAAASVWWRDEIVRRWPAANLIYGKIGLAVPLPHDVLRLEAHARLDGEEGAQRLIIEGSVTNISPVAQPVPKLKVELRDERQQVVESWTFSVSTDRLLPGASVSYTTTKPRNPAAASMAVDFAGRDE
jgi:predicted Zn finger-like uncharacterized protein